MGECALHAGVEHHFRVAALACNAITVHSIPILSGGKSDDSIGIGLDAAAIR
ncbi:hypothetical protein [Mycobacterium lepromatosis]|uniref:hypothetical protein n=1 Tax=Mycobacterium lepromatosis TaxID=480418 RepID=UPI0012E0A822|nr:hypothetical protein [Mycobacterium lepromatosis]